MRMKKTCELCSNLAIIYCGSDQASLCSQCDAKVHGANFLVAKHSRTLLCHVCQSQTPWTGSGPKLGLAISVCQTCLRGKNYNSSNIDGDHDNEEDRDDDDDDDGDDDDFVDDKEDEDDGDNQVVPWSYSVSHSR